MTQASVSDYSHLELNCSNMMQTLNYFSDVLGMTLVSIQWADSAKNAVRAFMRLNDRATISFLATLRTPIDIVTGVTHSKNAADNTRAGTLQHIAFNVDTVEDLLALRDRIRASGVHCLGPMDHGFCYSIYFAGPDDTALEISTTTNDMSKWIVPSVVDYIGLTDEELERLKA
ncbi:VOC family protein [Spongiibacter sp. KMU-166]|uniref:VOC family protein n=1 Tax=Spongiibacter thalassae TaxID=2721624 RepID=A0ABX1GBB7_9GAMM|nr:VOC family protein [Spongiibacter thalassae]NKI15893.1 VOC family protein [Spongiibacter thalassae]